METNPHYYGLSSRIELVQLSKNCLGIKKVIKSRIIRKDTAKIIEIARQIKSVAPGLSVTLICTRNICSRSLILLIKEGVDVEYTEID